MANQISYPELPYRPMLAGLGQKRQVTVFWTQHSGGYGNPPCRLGAVQASLAGWRAPFSLLNCSREEASWREEKEARRTVTSSWSLPASCSCSWKRDKRYGADLYPFVPVHTWFPEPHTAMTRMASLLSGQLFVRVLSPAPSLLNILNWL